MTRQNTLREPPFDTVSLEGFRVLRVAMCQEAGEKVRTIRSSLTEIRDALARHKPKEASTVVENVLKPIVDSENRIRTVVDRKIPTIIEGSDDHSMG
jgi:hypothetical protein